MTITVAATAKTFHKVDLFIWITSRMGVATGEVAGGTTTGFWQFGQLICEFA
jgi:hypothetical protein